MISFPIFHVHGIQEVTLNEKWSSPNTPVHVARIPCCIQLHSFYYEVPEDISRPMNVSLLQDAL